MKKIILVSLCVLVAFLGITSSASAQVSQAVEYVKICSLYGAGFQYIAGTDTCWNPQTGDARVATEGGVWRSILPYPEGNWSQQFKRDCQGRIFKVGDFASTDFVLNPWNRKETAPVPLVLEPGQFITKVIMSGGFYDPRIPSQGGNNGTVGLCLRGKDPTVVYPSPLPNPAYGNGFLPIGCIANSRIVNMPLPYSINPTAAYPQTYSFFPTDDQTVIAGPFTYGKQLVVTTDLGPASNLNLTYHDSTTDTDKPLAGTLTVHVCIGGLGFTKP